MPSHPVSATVPVPADPAEPPPPEVARPGRSAVARNAFHLVLGQAGTTTIAVLLSAALGRTLGASDFGRYFLFTSAAAFAFVVVEWGQGTFLIREVARQPERLGSMLGSALGLRLSGAILATGLTALVALLVGWERQDCLLAALTVLTLIPFFLSQAYGSAFRGRERMEYDALVSVLNKGLTLALTLTALLLRGGLVWVILAQAGAGLGALGLAIALGRRMGVRARGFTTAVARELVVGGTPIVAMTLAISAQAYIDAMILSRMAPGPEMGWYGAAKNIIGTLIAPATILGTANFPRLSRAASHPDEFKTEIRLAMRPVLLLGALAGVGTYLFADLAISVIYGQREFGAAATILRVFAPGLFLLFIDVLFGSIIVAAGRSFLLAIAKVLNVAATTALDVLLIPYFHARHGNGGIGVVVAFGVSELIMFGAALLVVPRASLGRALLVDFGKALLAATGTLLLVVAVPYHGSLLASVAVLAAAVAVFGALAFILRLVGPGDVQMLLGIFRRSGRRAPGQKLT